MKRKILVNEDFDDDLVRSYIEGGFEVHVRSKRKINKKDKKTYNKLKKVSLTEDNLRFGEVKELNDKYDYDLILTGEDPFLEKLLVLGRESKGKVIKSSPINSMEEAIKFEEESKNVDMKFVTVKVYYKYEEIPGIPSAKSGSRPFCTRLMATSGKRWTLEEISGLSNGMKGGVSDPFQFRGGFYHNPDSGVTTPWCRHQWSAEVVIEP
jgi:hypothetical protein